jgi:hypothetical protein
LRILQYLSWAYIQKMFQLVSMSDEFLKVLVI